VLFLKRNPYLDERNKVSIKVNPGHSLTRLKIHFCYLVEDVHVQNQDKGHYGKVPHY